jgi:hypothetical protein
MIEFRLRSRDDRVPISRSSSWEFVTVVEGEVVEKFPFLGGSVGIQGKFIRASAGYA